MHGVSGRDDGPTRLNGLEDPGRVRTWTRFANVYPGGKIAHAGGGGMRCRTGGGPGATPYARSSSSIEEAGLTFGGVASIIVPCSEEYIKKGLSWEPSVCSGRVIGGETTGCPYGANM